ncbi:MAG TPA: hypothetical protein VGD78_04265 [Chthoniobacterales bacterium]
MRDELIACLRRVPFAPFIVALKTGEVYSVAGVERLCVGSELWAVVDQAGSIRVHSLQAIESIVTGGGGEAA